MVAAVPTLAPTPAYDNDIVYECMPCIRIYKNCVQHFFSSEFFIGAAAIGVASCDRVISLEVSTCLYPPPTSLRATTPSFPSLSTTTADASASAPPSTPPSTLTSTT
ncbi:hypothetical protein D1007_14246 [Hordeum vulgare]|nr:hypothetical protein D1007_14246 [Hordeum vulgare]